MTREHKTRKGTLLASMEHRCEFPGSWVVEGYRIWRGSTYKYWRIRTLSGKRVSVPEGDINIAVWATFTEALEVVADRVASKG